MSGQWSSVCELCPLISVEAIQSDSEREVEGEDLEGGRGGPKEVNTVKGSRG